MNTYKLIVEFEKDYEDDILQAKKDYPKLPLKKALIALFAEEMQDAYDAICLSGEFQVKSIERNMKCQDCNSEIGEYRFCPYCGTEQDAYPYDEIKEPESDTKPLDTRTVKGTILPFIAKHCNSDGEIDTSLLEKRFDAQAINLMFETGYIYEPVKGKVKAI